LVDLQGGHYVRQMRSGAPPASAAFFTTPSLGKCSAEHRARAPTRIVVSNDSGQGTHNQKTTRCCGEATHCMRSIKPLITAATPQAKRRPASVPDAPRVRGGFWKSAVTRHRRFKAASTSTPVTERRASNADATADVGVAATPPSLLGHGRPDALRVRAIARPVCATGREWCTSRSRTGDHAERRRRSFETSRYSANRSRPIGKVWYVEDRTPDSAALAASLTSPAEFAPVFDRHYDAVHAYLQRRVGPTRPTSWRRRLSSSPSSAGRATTARDPTPGRGSSGSRPTSCSITVAGWSVSCAPTLGRGSTRSSTPSRGRGPPRRRRPRARARDGARAAAGRGSWRSFSSTAWADLSYPEIATALEIPVGTVRSRLWRARGGSANCGGRSGKCRCPTNPGGGRS